MVQGDDKEIRTKMVMGLRVKVDCRDYAMNGFRCWHAAWEDVIKKSNRRDPRDIQVH